MPALFVAPPGDPPPPLKPGFEAVLGAAFGQDVLGSEDTRRGGWYGLTWVRPEPRLRYQGMDAALVLDTHYMFTKGGGFEDIPVNQMHTYGITAAGRYPLPWVRSRRLFLDLGWGFSYNSIRTRDLDSHLNSTPFVGLGWQFDQGSASIVAFHMSNGGFSGNNQGLNQIQFRFGFRL